MVSQAGPALGRPVRVPNRQILRSPIAVMHQRPHLPPAPRVEGLLQGIERQVTAERRRHAPADNAPGGDVDHKREVDEPAPGRDVREVGHPALIGALGRELPRHQVPVARSRYPGPS